jgi:signal peptidase I
MNTDPAVAGRIRIEQKITKGRGCQLEKDSARTEWRALPALEIFMNLNWLTSKTVREANAMCKHVHKLLQHQRDILSAKAISEVEASMRAVQDATVGKVDKAALEKKMEELEETANKWIKPYPNSAWRENVEVLLVALAVAMGIRTFFLQPFKIPTMSMQPTLYGITPMNLRTDTSYQRPTGMGAVKDWLGGASYMSFKADHDGTFDGISKPLRLLIFNVKQTLWFDGKPHNFWFVPDAGGGLPLPYNFVQTLQAMFTELPAASQTDPSDLERLMGVPRGTIFRSGDEVLKMKFIAGDHLFIDRLSYNFATPGRGDIVVFQTSGIPEEKRYQFRIPPDEFYIKRLVGLGGETLSLQPDYLVTGVLGMGDVLACHLVIDGHPLSAATPGFAKLYAPSNRPANGAQAVRYQPDRYYGHGSIPDRPDVEPELAIGKDFHVRPDHLFVMGDNTMNSLDSRYWGDFPEEKVIGKAFFVYWPLSERFGLKYH